MDWWQTVGLMATLVATAIAVATLGWRIMLRMQRAIEMTRRELGREIDGMHQESRDAHDKIGNRLDRVRDDLSADIAKLREDLGTDIAKLRDDLGTDIAKLRDDLGADMAKVRTDLGADIASGSDGLVGVREGLAELRGEMRGVSNALQALQEDFRTHVYGRSARA